MLMAAILLVCCAVPGIIRTADRHHSTAVVGAAAGHTRVNMAWQTSTNKLTDLTFSSNGQYLAAVDCKSAVCVYNIAGKKQYISAVPGIDRVVICPDGSYSMAFSHLDRDNTTCTFLDNKGKICWDLRVNGAVWSADSCSIDGGARFVIGTGTKRVYVVDIGAHRKYYKWWTAPGAVVSLYVEPDGEDIIFGTWQDSSVERRSVDGRRAWHQDADLATLPNVEKLGVSGRLAVRYLPNNRCADGSYEIIGVGGREIARGSIDASEKTRVLFDPTGKYVCINYTEVIEHKGKSMIEKRTVLQDASGTRLWEKGSAFFQTDPILVTSKGEVLLRDANNAVFITGGSGTLKQVMKLQAKPLRCAYSKDGSLCALSCSDGSLHLLKLSR